MKEDESVSVVHQGRGGYVEYRGARYAICMESNGSFTIAFPGGNTKSSSQAQLDTLKNFCATKNPVWFIESRSRKHT